MKRKKNITLWIGFIMLGFILFIAFIAPYLPLVDQELTQERHRWNAQDRLELPPYPPSGLNWLGSDKAGYDNLSKLVMGTKETLFIIFGATMIRYLIAVPIGLLAYKKSGPLHTIVSSWNQVFSFLPTIFSVILLINLPFFLFSSNRLMWSILILAIVEAGRVAYIVQQQTHAISLEPFVESGTMQGLSRWAMIRSYYFPSLVPELITNFCIDLGKVTLLIGQLGVMSIFLNHNWVTTGPSINSFVNTSLNWVSLLAQHRGDIYSSKFFFIFFPAGMILFTILTFNVLGEGFRKYYNRKIGSYL